MLTGTSPTELGSTTTPRQVGRRSEKPPRNFTLKFIEKSTWEQPPEMNHIKFKDPKIAEGNSIIQGTREISGIV